MATIRGEDYAQAGMTDATTALGMRLAMFEAVEAWKTLPADQQNAQTAVELIGQQSRNNDLLQAAGTGEVVARFYENLSSKGDVVSFLNEVDAKSVDTIKEFIRDQNGDISVWGAATSPLTGAASSFSKASKNHLGMGTLTETFIDHLKTNPELTNGVTIDPKEMTKEQMQLVASYDGIFRKLDTMDASLPLVGSPEVQHLIAPPPKEALDTLGLGNSKAADFKGDIPQALGQMLNAVFGVLEKAMNQFQGLDVQIKQAVSFDPNVDNPQHAQDMANLNKGREIG